MFEHDDPELILRSLGAISHLTKSLNTVGSLFHAYSLATVHAVTHPASALKEIFTGGAGIRAAVKAMKTDANDPIMDGWLRNGLVAETEDIQRTIVAETGQFIDNRLSRLIPSADSDVKLLQHITSPLDKHVLQKLNTFTWDYMHSGQKIHMANTLLDKAIAKNPKIPVEQLQQEIAKFVNNSFGGLDWLTVASDVQNKYLQAFAMKAGGIRGRAWGQVLLFAPDWTVSTIRASTTALPKELLKPQNWELREGIKGISNPKTQGDFARRYVINTAVAYFTLLNGINMMSSGHPIWANEDPTRIDLGDGTMMQPAKHSMEFAEWVRDPDKTLGNKFGFWPKAAVTMTTGVAYPSPTAPKLKDTTSLGRLKQVGISALPFQVGAATQAPEGQGSKRALASSLGMPVYGVTRKERAAAIAKGKLKKAKEKAKKKQ
jgi:hypothetical protein